jgi:hypothetical protein
MPIETVRFVVSGANPQTKNVEVSVDPVTGVGVGSFVYTGVNSGTDTVQAYMDSQSLDSNNYQVNWQQSNGPLGLGPVTTNIYAGSGVNYTGTGALLGGPYTGNSLVFNQVYGNAARGVPGFPITGFSTTDGNTGAYKRVPPSNQQQSANGSWISDTYYPEAIYGYNGNHQGSFVVTEPGNYTFYFLADDSWVFFLGGGASRVSGSFAYTATSKAGLPQVGSRNGGAALLEPVDMVVINFPTEGVYPFEIGHAELNSSQGSTPQDYLVVTYTQGVGVTPTVAWGQYGQDILPISAMQAATPSLPGTGNLVLTQGGGLTNVPNLLIQGQTVTFGLQLLNIQYTTQPFIPLLEGTAGSLAIYNDPTANTFTLPQFNGAAVSDAAAASAIFDLSGDNNSWQGRLNCMFDGTNFILSYGGQAFDPNVLKTMLTITNPNIAWYNPSTRTFDLFTPTSQGGGPSLEIEVDYQVHPVIASITPNTAVADGSSVRYLLTLVKPLHTLQAATNAVFTGTGGIVVTGSVANVNSAGQITGWTITATNPDSTSPTTGAILTTLSGTIQFLSGTTFVTENVTYLNAVPTDITFSGATNSDPTNFAFEVTSNGVDASVGGVGDSAIFTCTIQALLSNFQQTAFTMAPPQSLYVIAGYASPTNIRQVGGFWYADYTATVDCSTWPPNYAYTLGYIETNADGGYLRYTSTYTYNRVNNGSDNVQPFSQVSGPSQVEVA